MTTDGRAAAGSRHHPAAVLAARSFGAHGHRIDVVARAAVLRMTEALTAPLFTSASVRDAEPGWTIRVHEEESTRDLESGAIDGLPVVDFTTNRWHVARREPDVVEVVIIDEGTAPARLVARPLQLTVDLFIERGDAPSSHWPSRLVKKFIGSRLLGDGWTAIHASSFTVAEGAVVCTGAPGHGKSSLTFAATVLRGASFMADDVTLLRANGDGRVIASGWPRRIALPAWLLPPAAWELAGGLRRSRLATTPTSQFTCARGPRIALDPDEHRRLLGVRYVAASPLLAVVALQTGPRPRQVSVSVLEGTRRKGALYAMLSTPSHRKVMTDPLRIFGPAQADATASDLDIPASVPVLLLRCGPDLVDRAAEVWGKLGRWVPLR